MFELKKIHLLSALKVAAILALMVGIAGVAIYFITYSFNNYGYYNIEALLFMPLGIFLASGISFVVVTVVVVPIYNLIAEHFGGIEIDLVRADN